jgi:microcystin-dependent protein
VASGQLSAILGGQWNTASQGGAVIAGGSENTGSGWWTFIGSGQGNVAAGNFSAILGGQYNEATGQYSSAMGRRAKARHDGTFVYGDNQDSDKVSTGVNQFLVYAGGGMAINTSPASGTALTVSGKVKSDSADLGATTVTTLTASSTISGFGTVPLGGIIMWSGAVTSIPAGWALCNGQTSNGRTTPNLSGRFIVGAGQGTGLSNRNVGDVGGTENHTLTVGQLPAHNHNVSGTTSENGNHSHGFEDDYFSECCPNSGHWGSGDSDGDNTRRSVYDTTYAAGSHTHTFNVTSGSAGSGEAFSKLPPFYALAFIMRVQ